MHERKGKKKDITVAYASLQIKTWSAKDFTKMVDNKVHCLQRMISKCKYDTDGRFQL